MNGSQARVESGPQAMRVPMTTRRGRCTAKTPAIPGSPASGKVRTRTARPSQKAVTRDGRAITSTEMETPHPSPALMAHLSFQAARQAVMAAQAWGNAARVCDLAPGVRRARIAAAQAWGAAAEAWIETTLMWRRMAATSAP